VIAMRAWWILPNRDQRDEILASDGKTNVPLRQILDPKLRPAGFSHGVPTELLEKCGEKAFAEILFAQRFPGWDGDKQLFSVFTPADKDSSGRVVHLGLLFILEPRERPVFELPYDGLRKEDQSYAGILIHRMTSSGRSDSWAQSVRELSELSPGAGPATNVALDRSVVRFYSQYVAGRDGLTRKTVNRRQLRMASIIFLILMAVVCGWLSVRGCEQTLRPVARTGVLIWRLN
jgi:hypothetical protein